MMIEPGKVTPDSRRKRFSNEAEIMEGVHGIPKWLWLRHLERIHDVTRGDPSHAFPIWFADDAFFQIHSNHHRDTSDFTQQYHKTLVGLRVAGYLPTPVDDEQRHLWVRAVAGGHGHDDGEVLVDFLVNQVFTHRMRLNFLTPDTASRKLKEKFKPSDRERTVIRRKAMDTWSHSWYRLISNLEIEGSLFDHNVLEAYHDDLALDLDALTRERSARGLVKRDWGLVAPYYSYADVFFKRHTTRLGSERRSTTLENKLQAAIKCGDLVVNIDPERFPREGQTLNKAENEAANMFSTETLLMTHYDLEVLSRTGVVGPLLKKDAERFLQKLPGFMRDQRSKNVILEQQALLKAISEGKTIPASQREDAVHGLMTVYQHIGERAERFLGRVDTRVPGRKQRFKLYTPHRRQYLLGKGLLFLGRCVEHFPGFKNAYRGSRDAFITPSFETARTDLALTLASTTAEEIAYFHLYKGVSLDRSAFHHDQAVQVLERFRRAKKNTIHALQKLSPERQQYANIVTRLMARMERDPEAIVGYSKTMDTQLRDVVIMNTLVDRIVKSGYTLVDPFVFSSMGSKEAQALSQTHPVTNEETVH